MDTLQDLKAWQDTCKMSFNPSKCSTMFISKKRVPLTRDYNFCGQTLHHSSSQPYLGVQLDSKLSWREPVDNTTAKANRTLGFLRRNLWFCPKEIKTSAYSTLIRPYWSMHLAPGTHARLVRKIDWKGFKGKQHAFV